MKKKKLFSHVLALYLCSDEFPLFWSFGTSRTVPSTSYCFFVIQLPTDLIRDKRWNECSFLCYPLMLAFMCCLLTLSVRSEISFDLAFLVFFGSSILEFFHCKFHIFLPWQLASCYDVSDFVISFFISCRVDEAYAILSRNYFKVYSFLVGAN